MVNRESSSDPLSTNPNPSKPSDSSPVQQVKDQAKNLAEEAKQQASDVAGQARDQVQGLVAQQKDRVAGQLGSLAGALRDTGHKLDEKDGNAFGQYANRAADKVDQVSKYLRDHEVGDVIRQAETLARRRPDVFLGGTFLAGLLLARFLKASGGHDEGDWNTKGNQKTGQMVPRTGQSYPRTGQTYPQAGNRGYAAPRPYTPPVGG